jgi:ferredoxin-NADP reductase
VQSGEPLLLIAAGTRGITPVRATLNWTPVLAHATTHRVAAFYAARSAGDGRPCFSCVC